jgi:Fic family protein
VSTNELEGVYSTRRQINELLQEGRDDTDPLGQKRFRELARLYLDLYGDAPERPSTVEDIRSIYDRVMSGEPLDKNHRPDGKIFRRDGVEIYAPNGKVIHNGVEPEQRIIEMIESMIAIANSDEIPETYSAIMGHFIFEYTHPFYDGNGRTGRYLLALHLSGPLSILTSLSLSRVLAENRGAYYKSFSETEHPLNHGELTSFVMNILESVSMAQNDLDVELARKREQYQDAIDKLQAFQGSHDLNDKETEAVYFLTLLQLFAAFPDSTLAELADHMELSTQQTRVHTRRLEEKGVILTTSKRPLRFVLSDGAISELDVART